MAITTLDQALAGMQPLRSFIKSVTATLTIGRPTTFWSLAGIPGPGSFDTTLNGVTLSAPQSGALPFTNPVSGNSYISKFQAFPINQGGAIWLCDRLWHNGGFTISSTSAQNITSPTWPARDIAGSTNGDGVFLAVEVSSTTGAGTPTITVSYTNQAGTSGRTGTNRVSTSASSAIGSFFPIGLQAGDTGVRSVQSLTLSSTWTSGTINLVAYRVISTIECSAAIPNAVDVLSGGLSQVYNDSVLFPIFIPVATTATSLVGSLAVTAG